MASTVHKISISLDPENHEWVTETARRERRSVSSVIDAALRMERQNQAALRVVDRIGVRATPEEAEELLATWSEASPARTSRKANPKKVTRSGRAWRRKSA